MPSTYTTNLGIEKIATGEQSGTWGTTTNTNLDLIDEAVNGVEQVTIAAAGSSGSPTDLEITNGLSSNGRNKFIEFIDGGDLGGTAFVQLTPNDAEKVVHIRNSLSADRTITIFQGTYNASNDFVIPNGADVVLKFDGAGAGAVVSDVNVNLTPTKITTATADITTGNITTVNATTVDSTNLEVTNLKAKDGTSAGSIADSTGVVTLASSVLTTADINGGSVDGATLGTNSAITEAQIDNINIDGNAITSTDTNGDITISPDGTGTVVIDTDLDVDNINIDGNAITSTDTNGNIALTPDGTGEVDISKVDIDSGTIDSTTIGGSTPAAGSFTGLTLTGDATFGDDDKAIFGAGSDLQIYHDTDATYGENASVIVDNGSGPLKIVGGQSGRVELVNSDGDTMLKASGQDAVTLYYDGAEKLATTNTGVDVTGTLTSDSLTVNGIVRIDENDPQIRMLEDDTTDLNTQIRVQDGVLDFKTLTDAEDAAYKRLSIDNATGDISFYEDTGTNARILYDADAEFVVNEDSADFDFRVESNNVSHAFFLDASTNDVFIGTSTDYTGRLQVLGGQDLLTLVSTNNASTDAPNLRLYRDSGSPAVNDSLGQILLEGNNDADERIEYVKIRTQLEDETDGSETARLFIQTMLNGTTVNRFDLDFDETVINESSQDLDFRVESDSNTHVLFVDAGNDRVGIGTGGGLPNSNLADIPEALFVEADASGGGSVMSIADLDTGAGGNTILECCFANDDVYGTANFIRFSDEDTALCGAVQGTGGNVNYNTSSDERLKQNIRTTSDVAEKIKNVEVRDYERIRNNQAEMGFIAQELHAEFPLFVNEGGDNVKEEPWTMDYGRLTPILWKGLQEALAKIEALEARVAQLEAN